jgi:K+-transporting ATPase ATPase C chain
MAAFSTTSLSRQMLAAVKALLVLTVLLGLVYPLAITAVARLASGPADGSLVRVDGTVVGSSLLEAPPSGPEWFQGRPSASDAAGDSSGGSNLAASNPAQPDAVAQRAAALRAANPQADPAIPVDALTASASGLDPDISPAYALWQVPRVAAARGVSADTLRALVDESTNSPLLGFVGSARVNVLALNLALMRLRAG